MRLLKLIYETDTLYLLTSKRAVFTEIKLAMEPLIIPYSLNKVLCFNLIPSHALRQGSQTQTGLGAANSPFWSWRAALLQ